MASGGWRPGAGRPKGSRNRPKPLRPAPVVRLRRRRTSGAPRPSRERLAAVVIQGITPLQCILENMRRHLRRGRWIEAQQSAALAAPYLHPRLSSSNITVKPSLREVFAQASDAELRSFIEENERELANTPEALATAKPKGRA